jgi:hypothetical protein
LASTDELVDTQEVFTACEFVELEALEELFAKEIVDVEIELLLFVTLVLVGDP